MGQGCAAWMSCLLLVLVILLHNLSWSPACWDVQAKEMAVKNIPLSALLK